MLSGRSRFENKVINALTKRSLLRYKTNNKINMKVVILAGGFGTRISEESAYKPKPMIEIGGMPILWHLMKVYSYYGVNEFIICAGYKQHLSLIHI